MEDLAILVYETNQAYKQMRALEHFGENDLGYITARLTYEFLLKDVQEAYKK